MENTDYLLEKRLKQLNPVLHEQFRNCAMVMTQMLDHYVQWFPTYTDHSVRHTLDVIEFCNAIVGRENMEKLNADEIFVFLLGCYVHDSGMSLNEKDYRRFAEELGFAEVMPKDDPAQLCEFIRTYHHEFSGAFIQHYGDFFEVPSAEHLFAIRQIARGHRKTDLFDEREYPSALRVPGGNTLCLPYLAALIRMADEIDVGMDRNPICSYEEIENFPALALKEWNRHYAFKHVEIAEEAFVLCIETDQEDVYEDALENREKIQKTLDYCRDVVKTRTPYHIQQKDIRIHRL